MDRATSTPPGEDTTVRAPRGAGGAAGRLAAPTAAGSALKDLVLITGYSGAGKSTAMAAFEDEGYFCVDNLPSEMIRSLVELFMHEGSKVVHAAVVSDARGGSYFEGLAAMLDDLRASGVTPSGAVPGGRRGDAADALQGDAPPASARPERQRRRGDRARAASCSRRCGAGRRGDRHHRADRGDAPPQARREMLPSDAPGGWPSPSRASASSTAPSATPT